MVLGFLGFTAWVSMHDVVVVDGLGLGLGHGMVVVDSMVVGNGFRFLVVEPWVSAWRWWSRVGSGSFFLLIL